MPPAAEHPAAAIHPVAVHPADANLIPSNILTASEEATELRTQVLHDFNDLHALRHINVDTYSLTDFHNLLHMLTPHSVNQTALLQLLAVATPPEDAADIWDA